ncbi:ABC transporter substrate-binding protein [Pseudactinotalea sp.]|uniref:ABC transporter substrate-binding protein n=1 Tax=Pseudactinotalea sp. TaxID=1926260 RepID=UPI003B3AC941
MQRRTFIALAAGLVPVLAGTAACTSRGQTASDTAVRFTWWGNAERRRATQEVIELFLSKHPEVEVAGEPVDDSYWDRLATTTAAGDAPDVITLGGAYVAEYAGRGALLDLAEVSAQLSTDGVDEAIIANGQVDGVQYAMTTGVNALAAIVNADVLAAAGVEVPDGTWTWSEYLALAAEVSERSPEGTYGTDAVLDHDTLDAFARQRGEALYTAEGQLGLTAATVTDFLTLPLQMIEAGAAPSAARINELSAGPLEQNLVGTGQAGMSLQWSNLLTAYSVASGADLRLVTLPHDEPENLGMWLQSSQYYGIYARSEYPVEAATFINFVLTDPEATALVGVDRGVPTLASVRERIAADLSGPDQAQTEYIDALRTQPLETLTIGPTGSTAVGDITQRAISDVCFGRLGPEEAADQWFSESEQAIA